MERLKPKALVAACLVLLGAGVAAAESDGSLDRLFTQACDLYEASDFESARDGFASLISGDVRNAAVYYNLGNCYYKQGQVGRAVASYRRALMLEPRDPEIKANLDLIRAAVGSRDTTSSFNLGSLARLPLGLVSPREWQMVFYVAYYASVMAFLGALFLASSHRRLAIRILILLVLISAASYGLHRHAVSRFEVNPDGVVIADQTEFMSGPGAAFEELTRLTDGVEVRLRARSGIWVEVELPTGQVGWVRQQDIEKI